MEGIKKKILIVFLIAVALVLGYQAYVMAIDEVFTKPAGARVPFQAGNYWIYCREHHNGWGYHGSVTSDAVDYKCVGEINTDTQKAYGFAYLLHKGTTSEVQSWIWAHSGSANGQYILNPGTDFSKYFTGYSGNDNIQQADGEELPEGAQKIEPVKLIDCLNDPTINIVDQVPYMFFDKENENLIQDISYEEYNYIYQLTYLFNHMNNQGENNNVESLLKHINTYKSDGTGTVFTNKAKTLDEIKGNFNEIEKIETTNKYGEEVISISGTLKDNRKVTLWTYSNNKDENEKYKIIYYSDDVKSGTTKFDDRLFFGKKDENEKKDILGEYITIYKENDITKLQKMIEKYGYVNLSNKLAETNKNTIFGKLKEVYDAKITKIVEIANEDYTDLGENGDVKIEHNNDNQYFKFSGNVYQAAKIYQWLMTDNRLAKYAENFKVNTNGAKVSIDVENGKYIIGPFSMNYATVVLNDNVILGVVDGTAALNGKSCFDVNLNGEVLSKDKYRIIKNDDDGKVPASGETFYIELNKDIKGEDDFLNKDDKITFTVRYTYVESISSTIHFLQGVNDGDSTVVFNTNHPQRLMTHETTAHEEIIEKTGSVSPDYYDFVIEKYEAGTENKLQGAVFAALACYIPESGYGSSIYLDLEAQKSGYKAIEGDYNGENGIFSALNNDDVKGKYETDEEGRITFANVPDKVTYDGTTYILDSVVAKETKAPGGYKLDDRHFEIKKDKNTATIKRENEKEKPYQIKVRKVDEKGNAISDLTFKYWYINLKENPIEASESGYDVYHAKQATTDENGIATFEGKPQGDLIALVACEVPDNTSKEYKYFNNILVLYSTKTDSNGNIQIEFFNSETASDAAKKLYKHNSYPIYDRITVTNGIYRLTTKEGKDLFGEEAKKYVQCGNAAGEDVDIQITNETIKPYNLELHKYDENGKTSKYLDGTEFEVTIGKQYQTVYKDTVIVKDGIAKIDGLKIYGENLYVYLKEKPKQGFKTDLYNETDGKGRMVLIYCADESGKIKIKYKNESALNPTLSKIEGYESATVVEGENGNLSSLRLGIINQPEEYALKFKKVNEKGEPLQGATFSLYKDDTCLGTDKTDPDGYMTFKGLTLTSKDESDIITLQLKEESAANGYKFSDSDVQLEYVYIPGSNVLKNIKITKVSDNSILKEQAELKIEGHNNIEENDKVEGNNNEKIIFNLRELNEIFEIVNTPNPYDLEFTKVDENGKPIADIDFNVSIYSINEDGTKNFVDSKDGKVENRKVTSSQDGKVIIKEINDYGTYYVEIKETSKSNKYETITDILRFNYTITPGDTKAKLGNTLEILDENGNVVKTYTRYDDDATKFQTEDRKESYDNVKIDNDDLYLINLKKPYDLVLNKVNGLTGKPIEGIEFSAMVFKNLTSEKQYFTGITDKDGNIVLKGIKIYSTPQDVEKNRERLTVVITEKFKEGQNYKWHEYGEITYTIDYKKFSADEPIEKYEGLGGIISAKDKDQDGNPMIKFLNPDANIEITEGPAGTQSDIIKIENMPVYDLPIAKKVERIGDKENEITGGIKFTAKLVNGNGETLQEDVKVTLDENGIIARDIEGTFTGENLKLILTEVENNKYDKIDDITVVYNCTYNKETDKFETQITDFEYQGKSYEFKDAKDLIDGLIYVVDGKAVLVNTPKTAELALRKVDEKGNPVTGVRFIGKVYRADDRYEPQSFDVTTENGLAVIRNISLKGEVKVVIEEEKWANDDIKEQFGYSELKFMKDIEISGIVINVDEKGNRTVDYTNAAVDDKHKGDVKINEITMEIEVTNKFLTYDLPIIKTTDLLSNNENAEKLPNVMFNVSIKNVGEGPAMTQVFNNVTTDSNGELVLSGINKFGDVVLTLEETVGAPNTTVLEKKVEIPYKATKDENDNIILDFGTAVYSDTKEDASDKVSYIEELLKLNVVNTRDYSITLHKIMNVDGVTQELNGADKVTFEGIVTTNKDIMININGEDKKVSELTYEEFANNIEKIKALDSEDTKHFVGDTENGLYKVSGLNFYKQTVYVYFIETDVPDSMTTIEEVMTVAFIQEYEVANPEGPISDKVSLNTENNLDIKLTVINNASSYKVNLIKVDEITGENVQLKNAKFKVALKGLEGKSVVSYDEVTISFDSEGRPVEEIEQGNYIHVNKDLVNGYIQLDVNKFGTLQLEITEESAPKHYIKYEDTMVVKYAAEPGKILGNEVIGAAAGYVTSKVETNQLSLDITIPNKPQPHDLTIKKVVKQTLESTESTVANNIKFDVKFFNTKGERIMPDKIAVYNVQNGEFTIEDIETIGEYYITLEEYDVPDDIVKLDGIHVFKIKATPEDIVDEANEKVFEDVVKEITYEGTVQIKGNEEDIDEATKMAIIEETVQKITSEGTDRIENDKWTFGKIESYDKYFNLKDEDSDIARLEITNIPVKQYYLDLTKVASDENGNIMKDDKGNPITLSGAEFSLYLTKSDKNYQTDENLLAKLGKTSGIETGGDGKIAIGPLKEPGEYKLTVIEDKAPKGYKKTFNIIEVIYYTKDGEHLEVRSIKVDGNEVKDKDTTAVEYGIGTNGGFASIELTIKNIEKKPVPISIHKIYYKDGSTQKLPVKGAIFSGVVREVATKDEWTFSSIETDENGMANLGSYPVDGEVEVEIKEIVAPAGLDKIEPSTIYITVNNETQKVDENNYTCSSNALEGIKDNTFTIVDLETYNPKITLAGLVWEDIKQNNKGEDTYTLEGYYTEGLYDAGYDRTIAGVEVKLYKKGWDNTPIATYTTGSDGTYVFDELDPFEKYYITFKYNGKDYEQVKYLVSGVNNGEPVSYGSISDAIDKANWKTNSKAVTNSGNENIATTTATDQAGNIQYYPIYDKFTIDDDGITLYIKDGAYTTDANVSEAVEFKPLQPSHQHINFGIKERPTFDLRLSKDVEYIKVTLNNGTSMEYKYGIKPDSSMYKLEINQADIKNIRNIEIVYKITVANEDLSDGTLKSIGDYYNSDILNFKEWSYNRNEGYTDNEFNIDREVTRILPEQTYDSTSSTLSKDNRANTERVRINTKNREIKSNESVDIYVKYEYTDKLIEELRGKSIGDEFVTLGVAEIWASESTTGRQDKDSNAGNLLGKFDKLNNFYEDNGEYSYYTKLSSNVKEDDEDAAPAAKIVVAETKRSISGNVFEDLNKDGKLTEGTANDDTLIKGITVELYDSKSNRIVAGTTTNENGEYKFTGIPAGEYKVRFTYGDKNTVLPILKDSEGTVINSELFDGYLRQNDKSYNALEFEATQSAENTGLYWYADSERKSDAKDTNPTRTNANNLLNETIAKSQDGTTTYGIMNNKQAERLYSYKGDTSIPMVRDYIEELSKHYVIAETPNFKVNMENTAATEVQYESEAENGTVYYEGGIIANTSLANNIDFGIKERPQSDITVTKEVENVKIYTSAGNVNVDVSLDENGKTVGTASRVQWNKGANSGKGYIWIQRSEEEIVGATLEITYKITVTNGAGEDITLRVADYVQDGMTYAEANNLDENKKAIWEIAKAQTELEGKRITSSKVGDVEINNTIDLRSVSTVLVKDIDLNKDNGYKADVNITLTKTLNAYSDTDIDAYTNYVEIIQTASKDLARKDINSIPGNYDPVKQKTTEGNLGKIVTSLDVNELEKDSSKALETISITAETGENRATYYILTFAVIAVFATGVVLIKKYAIKK